MALRLLSSEVIHTEILLPEHAPAEYSDRTTLWNAVEKSERYVNAQLAREVEVSLPAEFPLEQSINLVREYVKDNFVNAGMCADICFHDTGKGNPHAHILLTMRPIEKDGKWGQKSKTVDGVKIPTVDWNDRNKAELWRESWANSLNAVFEQNGSESRIDHRSYERQGIEKIPTIHLGAAAAQMEKRGIRTERGDINRAIEVTNKELRQLRARITKLEKWIAQESVNTEPPTLADVITDILKQQGQSGITRLKAAAEMLLFLNNNKIYDMAGLKGKVRAMRGRFNSVHAELKKTERRIDTLKEHVMHSDNFKNHRKIKLRYEELYSIYETAKKETGFGSQRKAQKALDAANEYHEAHRPQLAMFDNADKYLCGVLQERYDPSKPPPMTKWREELNVKTAERDALYGEYRALKDETQKVERIKRSASEIIKVEMRERALAKVAGAEL